MTPGLSHAVIAAVMTFIVSGTSMVLGGSPGLGMAVAIGFYLGRERRQAEEAFGSNRIPPWRFLPRSLRDLAWPALASAAVTGLLLLARTADLRP